MAYKIILKQVSNHLVQQLSFEAYIAHMLYHTYDNYYALTLSIPRSRGVIDLYSTLYFELCSMKRPYMRNHVMGVATGGGFACMEKRNEGKGSRRSSRNHSKILVCMSCMHASLYIQSCMCTLETSCPGEKT